MRERNILGEQPLMQRRRVSMRQGLGCRSVLATMSAGVGLATTLTACAPEPQGVRHESAYLPVQVSVDSSSMEQRVLGELYVQAFNNRGRMAYINLDVDSDEHRRVQRLHERTADVVVGCTGELLQQMNPARAKELSEKYVADKESGDVDPNSGEWRDRVYKEMVKSLPGSMMATDPSNATGCEQYSGPELPQNIVPIYRKPILNRNDRQVLNNVDGLLTTSDLSELSAEAEKQSSVSAVVIPFIEKNDL